jgi:ribosomal protein L40E
MTDQVAHIFRICGCGAQLSSRGAARCRKCHAAYMRDWRKSRPKPERAPSASLSLPALEQRRAQDLARQHKHRGLLSARPCQVCESADAQMHHPDYSRPLDICWLCNGCHADWHRFWRELSTKAFAAWFASARAAIYAKPIDPGELAATQVSVR